MKKRIDLLTLFILCMSFNPLSAFVEGDIVDPTINDITTARIDQDQTQQEEDAQRRAAEEAERLREEKEHDQSSNTDNTVNGQHKDSDTTPVKTPSSPLTSPDIVTDNANQPLSWEEQTDLKKEEERREEALLLEKEQKHPQTPEDVMKLLETAEALRTKITAIRPQLSPEEIKRLIAEYYTKYNTYSKSPNGLENLSDELIQTAVNLAKQQLFPLIDLPKALLKNKAIAARVKKVESIIAKIRENENLTPKQLTLTDLVIKNLNEKLTELTSNGPEKKNFLSMKKWSYEQKNNIDTALSQAEIALTKDDVAQQKQTFYDALPTIRTNFYRGLKTIYPPLSEQEKQALIDQFNANVTKKENDATKPTSIQYVVETLTGSSSDLVSNQQVLPAAEVKALGLNALATELRTAINNLRDQNPLPTLKNTMGLQPEELARPERQAQLDQEAWNRKMDAIEKQIASLKITLTTLMEHKNGLFKRSRTAQQKKAAQTAAQTALDAIEDIINPQPVEKALPKFKPNRRPKGEQFREEALANSQAELKVLAREQQRLATLKANTTGAQ